MSITSWEGDQEPTPKEKSSAETQPESANPPKDTKINNPPETRQRKFSITSWEGDQKPTQKEAGAVETRHSWFSWEQDEGKIKIGKTLEKIRFHGEKSEFKFFTGGSVGALTGYLLLKSLFTLPMTTLNWLIKYVPEKIGGVTVNPIDQKAYFQAYNQLAQAFSHKKKE